MTLKESIQFVAKTSDAVVMNNIINFLRFKHNFRYTDCLNIFQKNTNPPISEAEFDMLCEEADCADSID